MNPRDRVRDNDPARAPAMQREARLRHKSETLFAGLREVIIEHRGEDYRLRLTSNGKLILTK